MQAVRVAVCCIARFGIDIVALLFATTFSALFADWLTYRGLPVNPHSPPQIWHAWGLGLIGIVLLAHLAGRGHYRLRITFWEQALDITSACILALICDLILTGFIYGDPLSASVVLRWPLAAISIVCGRVVAQELLTRLGFWRLRTLVIGDGTLARRAATVLTGDRSMGYDVVGTVAVSDIPDHPDPEWWYGLVTRHGADFIAAAGGEGTSKRDTELLSSLSLTRIGFTFLPALDFVSVVGCDPQHVHRHDAMLITMQPRWTEPLAYAAKSTGDFLGALLLLLLLAPTFAVIALLIRLDGGPALYRQKRIGKGGREFDCFKFRSMRVDADRVLEEMLETDPAAAAEWAATRKLANDPRITSVGRFIRKTSLDELPQFWNILRGEMSFVGPRPIVADEMRYYGVWASFYTKMKPGLTGLWQASGRSGTSYAQRVQLDVWYARNWTLWQDVAIVLMSLPAVLLRKGAV